MREITVTKSDIQNASECICYVEWGAGDYGRSVCGIGCLVHTVNSICDRCGKKVHQARGRKALCVRCEESINERS